MRRHFLLLAISLAVGILIAHYFRIEYVYSIFIFLCTFTWAIWFRKKKLFPFFLGLSVFTLGLLLQSYSQEAKGGIIGDFVLPTKISLEGYVCDSIKVKKQGKKETISFVLKVEKVGKDKNFFKAQEDVQIFLYNTQKKLNYGDYVRVRGSLIEPKGATNPGQFDYSLYLKRLGIKRILQGFGKKSLQILSASQGNRFLSLIFQLRQKIKEIIDRFLPFPENELLAALILGRRDQVPYEIQDQFVRTGTAHVLAISGLHISILAGAIYFLLRLLYFPQKINAFLTIIFIIVYIFLGGFKSPIQRAGIMGIIVLMGLILGEESDSLHTLCLAFLTLLVCNSRYLFFPAFQLSFLAVASLIILTPKIYSFFKIGKQTEAKPKFSWLKKIKNFFLGILVASFAATLGSFPLVVYYFNIFSPLGVLVNVLVIPLISLVIFSGMIFILMAFLNSWAAQFIAVIPSWALKATLYIINYSSHLALVSFNLPRPPIYLLVGYYLCLLTWLYGKTFLPKKFLQITSMLLWHLILLAMFFSYQKKGLSVTFLDLGQNQAVFLKCPSGETILINGGRRNPSDQGRWIVAPYLRSQGVNRLDLVLLTSFYEKNLGGLLTVLDSFPCRYFLIPFKEFPSENFRRLKKQLEAKKTPVIRVKPGDEIKVVKEVKLKLLDLDTGLKGADSRADNSLIFKLAYKNFSCLFLFEANERVLTSLIAQKDFLGADIILLPNRSKYLTELEKNFLNQISPRWLVYNGQGKNLAEVTPEALSTSQKGAISFFTDGNSVQVKTYI